MTPTPAASERRYGKDKVSLEQVETYSERLPRDHAYALARAIMEQTGGADA